MLEDRALAPDPGVDAVVIRTAEGLRAEDLRQTIGYFAGPVIAERIGAASRIAVAGGRTMQVLAEQMKPTQPKPGLSFIQAMGNIDSNPGLYDAAELGRLMARRWGDVSDLDHPGDSPRSGNPAAASWDSSRSNGS